MGNDLAFPKCNQPPCHCPACHIPHLSLHLSRNHPTLLRCRNSQNPAKQTRRRIPFRRPMRLLSQHWRDTSGCSPTVNSWINAKNKTWDSMLPLSTSQKLSTWRAGQDYCFSLKRLGCPRYCPLNVIQQQENPPGQIRLNSDNSYFNSDILTMVITIVKMYGCILALTHFSMMIK